MSRVLLVTSQRWPTTAMLADALMRAGAEVGVLSPPGHPARALRQIRFQPIYSHPRRLPVIARAIGRMAPDMVIPGDDDAALALHQLHRKARLSGDDAMARLIERSLGEPGHYGATLGKSLFIEAMAGAGVAVPATTAVADRAALQEALSDGAWPRVIKADGWSAGRGVYVVRDRAEAMAAWDTIHRVVRLPVRIKDVLRERSMTPLYRESRPRVAVQDFVTGAPVTRAVACWRGQVIAGRSFKVIETRAPNSHATVVLPCHLPEADAAVERAAAHLGLTGLHGFDFMQDARTGKLLMIEVNPRVTSGSYTAPRGATSVAQRLAAFLADPLGGPYAIDEADPAQMGDRPIALFPQEWERDPDSAWLSEAEQQTPLDRPQLVKRCLAMIRSRSLLSQAADLIRGRRPARA